MEEFWSFLNMSYILWITSFVYFIKKISYGIKKFNFLIPLSRLWFWVFFLSFFVGIAQSIWCHLKIQREKILPQLQIITPIRIRRTNAHTYTRMNIDAEIYIFTFIWGKLWYSYRWLVGYLYIKVGLTSKYSLAL